MIPEVLRQRGIGIFNDLSDQILQNERPIFAIFRGLPGSGKSTVSKYVQGCFQAGNTQVVRVCTDEVLEMCEGSYLWAGHKMRLYHGIAFKMVCLSFNNDVPVVLLDNTNIQTKDYEHYITDARQKGYDVRVFVIGEFSQQTIDLCVERNSHNVPRDAIERMARRFQE